MVTTPLFSGTLALNLKQDARKPLREMSPNNLTWSWERSGI
jgi:hypothetical protein